MADHGARVVLLGLDGFPARVISPEITPRLWRLGESGGRAAYGVTALPSSTYPGFASLLTGRLPRGHGVRTTAALVYSELPAWAGSWRQVQVPTLFDACRRAGLASAAIQGDHLMHGLLKTEAATLIWPREGTVPPGTPLDDHGYPTNAAVRPHLLAAMADGSLDFVFGHLNEADTVGHDFGPDSEPAQASYRATDAVIGELLDAAIDWDRTLVIVVSDHDMAPRTSNQPIKLLDTAEDLVDGVIADGGSALAHLRPGVNQETAMAAIGAVEGVEMCVDGDADFVIAGARPGFIFDAPYLPPGGYHGGPATARTVATVGGGHPAARRIGRAIEARPPHLADWAPTIAALLGLHMPGTESPSPLRGG
jgi:arylsulfatase A-like enzyme